MYDVLNIIAYVNLFNIFVTILKVKHTYKDINYVKGIR